MKSQTTVTEEDIRLPVAEQREPWTLPGSIFKPRVKECDARAFYDGGAVSTCGPAHLLSEACTPSWVRCCCFTLHLSMLLLLLLAPGCAPA